MTASSREAIAAAATTVADVYCTPFWKQTTKVGTAMVRYDRTDYAAFGGVVTWQVVVIIPAEQGAAERWVEEHLTALEAALRPEFIELQFAEPRVLVPAGIFALVIQGTREQDLVEE